MHYRILFLLVVFAQTSALRIAPAALSRADAIRAALGTAYAVSTAAPVLAVDLDDEDEVDANDEVPDVRMRGGAPRVKPGDRPATKKVDAAAGQAAFADIVAARKGLDKLSTSLASGDLKTVGMAISGAPYASLEDSLLTLVQSPLLGADEKKQIGTIKRYGVGADVLIMMGGLNAAVRDGDGGGAKSFLTKASNALDEVLLVCKSCGLKI